MTPCQKLLKQEGTARRIESMQQSVAEDCCMLSMCLLVSIVFGMVSSLHPTSFLMIFTLVSLIFNHKYGQDTVGSLASLHSCYSACSCSRARTRSMDILMHMRHTHKMPRLRHLETPVELSVSLFDSFNEFICSKGSSLILL